MYFKQFKFVTVTTQKLSLDFEAVTVGSTNNTCYLHDPFLP